MGPVPAIHVRDVPSDIVDSLKRRAKKNGRSLNGEIVNVLEASVEEEQRRGWVAKRLEELRARGPLLPEDAPKPEDVIRQARDERAREIERRARRP